MIRVLVTAFGAFPGAAANPTMTIAARLARQSRRFRRAGIHLETATLPVVYASAAACTAAAIAGARPDIVLHLGLAGRRKVISVETRARNRLSTIHPDSARRYSGSLTVEAAAPAVRRSRYDGAALAQAMRAQGAKAQLSIDAGDYLCNQVLFLSLGLHAGACGFIHVPKPRRMRPPGGRNAANALKPSLDAMTAAIAAAIRQLAASGRTAARPLDQDKQI